MDGTTAKRFVRALRAAQELLAGEAKCYRYENELEYMEMKEDLKFAIRMLEDGTEFAGKLLYKNAQKVRPGDALELARHAKSEEERNFFAYLSDMNLQRAQQAYVRSKQTLDGPSAPANNPQEEQ